MADVDLDSGILRPAIARAVNELRVATVGRVTSAVRTTGRAAVALLVRYVTSDGQEHQWPDSPSAVVVQPRGDGYAFACDVVTGDPGVLVAADNGWEQVWKTGQAARPPVGVGVHNYGAAAFVSGGRFTNEAPANAKGACRVGAEDGSAAVDFTRARGAALGSVVVSAAGPAASVKLGSAAASQTLAYQAQTAAVLDALIAIVTAEVAFWNAYVPLGPDAVALKTFYTSTLTPLVTALTVARSAMVGTLKTVAE